MLRELTADEDARRYRLEKEVVGIKALVLLLCPDVQERSEAFGYLELAQARAVSTIAAKIPSCFPFTDLKFYRSKP